MQISSFKLVAGGSNGLKAVCEENVQKTGNSGIITIKDKVTREREVPVPWEIKKKINDLKYDFLVSIGRWDGDWSKYLNEDKTDLIDKDKIPTNLMFVWDNSKITGVSKKNKGFVLTGVVRIIGHKTVTENSPFLTDSDQDFEIFDETMHKIQEAFDAVQSFLLDERFSHAEPKAYLLDLFSNKPDEQERINALDDDECDQEMIDRLAIKGIIAIKPEEVMSDVIEEVLSEVKEEVSTEVIGSLNGSLKANIPALTEESEVILAKRAAKKVKKIKDTTE